MGALLLCLSVLSFERPFQMFGRQAMEYVAYVECYPEGYRSGVQIAAACKEADIQGFPTWIVKGQVGPSMWEMNL